MIIALIYILFYLMWYLINSWKQLKIISRKSQVSPSEKIYSPFFTHSLLKIQKLQVTHFLPTLKIFRPPAEKGEGGAGGGGGGGGGGGQDNLMTIYKAFGIGNFLVYSEL